MVEPCVHALLPRAGLGNKMLVWARALVFARLNSLPLYVSGWAELKLGPYLRRERSKRQYWGYFSRRGGAGPVRRAFWRLSARIVREPELGKVAMESVPRNTVFRFDTMPSGQDFFAGLRCHEEMIRAELMAAITPRIREMATRTEPPVIGVHVRRSDFREPLPGEDMVGSENVRTPLEHYCSAIERIRAQGGECLPVTVFTDGHPEEVEPLLRMRNVQLAAPHPDIVDLLLLSRSRWIVVSARSTFSYWAAFLSRAHVITHPAHEVKLRNDALRRELFEGSMLSVPNTAVFSIAPP